MADGKPTAEQRAALVQAMCLTMWSQAGLSSRLLPMQSLKLEFESAEQAARADAMKDCEREAGRWPMGGAAAAIRALAAKETAT